MKDLITEKKIENKRNTVPTRETYINIIDEVKGINMTVEDAKKIKIFIAFELGSSLFDGLESIYNFIGQNLKNPQKYIIIPYINNGREHLIIQRLA